MTLRLSWSQLRTHEECKQKGHLQRTGKRPSIDNQRIFFPGTVTDRVVRDWLLNKPEENRGGMPAMVSEIIDREREIIAGEGGEMVWKDKGDRAQVEKDCREAVEKIEPALLRYVTPFRNTPDFKFRTKLDLAHPGGGTEQVELIGAMDILVQDDKDRFWVWDVKHTRDDYYWKKTEGQLGFYSLIVQIMYGVAPVRVGLLQPLCKKIVLPLAVTPETRSQLMQRISLMASDRWSEIKTPRADTKMCGFCNVKHACEKYKPKVDGRNKRLAF